jgi:hypothetical protein
MNAKEPYFTMGCVGSSVMRCVLPEPSMPDAMVMTYS